MLRNSHGGGAILRQFILFSTFVIVSVGLNFELAQATATEPAAADKNENSASTFLAMNRKAIKDIKANEVEKQEQNIEIKLSQEQVRLTEKLNLQSVAIGECISIVKLKEAEVAAKANLVKNEIENRTADATGRSMLGSARTKLFGRNTDKGKIVSAKELSGKGKSYFTDAKDGLTLAKNVCQTKKDSCIIVTPGNDGNTTFNPEVTLQQSQDVASDMQEGCLAIIEAEIKKTTTGILSATGLRDSATDTMNAFATGAAIGSAALVGGVMYKNKKDDDEAKDKKKKREKEFESGVARNEDGTTTNCISQNTYTNPECKPVLLNYCAKDENASKGGCIAFANSYCSAEDAAQAYCVSKQAAEYCKQQGPYIGQSPACQWIAARPADCKRNPENINCLANVTPSALQTACADFPNDPLCAANAAGKVVTQSFGATAVTGFANASGGSGALNDLVGQSDQSSITSQSVWRTNSAAYEKLCAQGQMVGCSSR